MNMSVWEILEIDETADLQCIRKAYARRLKNTRPEDDAHAFQLLTDAYEYATSWASTQARTTPRHNDETPPETNTIEAAKEQPEDGRQELGRPLDDTGPAHENSRTPPDSVQEEIFAFAPFFESLAVEMKKKDPRHLKLWLEAHPDLYSMELKHVLVPHVFDALAHQATELKPNRGHLDVLRNFFGVDVRLRRHPALAPALDYLEFERWKSAASDTEKKATPMPKGWENLSEVIPPESGRKTRQTFDLVDLLRWLPLLLIFPIIGKVLGFIFS